MLCLVVLLLSLLMKGSGCDTLSHIFGDSITSQEFFSTYFEKTPVYIRRNSLQYSLEFFSIERLDELLGQFSVWDTESDDKFLGKHGSSWKLVKSTKKDGKFVSTSFIHDTIKYSDVKRLFSKGYSIVINHAQHYDVELMSFLGNISQCFPHFGFHFNLNIYFTPTNSQAFEEHYDWMDVLVIQILGNKNWQISEDFEVEFPVKKTITNGDHINSPKISLNMTPGSVLYLPRGISHEATCIPNNGPCLHFTIGIEVDGYSTMRDFSTFIREEYAKIQKNDSHFEIYLEEGNSHLLPETSSVWRWSVFHFLNTNNQLKDSKCQEILSLSNHDVNMMNKWTCLIHLVREMCHIDMLDRSLCRYILDRAMNCESEITRPCEIIAQAWKIISFNSNI